MLNGKPCGVGFTGRLNPEIPCFHVLSYLKAGMAESASPCWQKLQGFFEEVWSTGLEFQMKEYVRTNFCFSCQPKFQYQDDNTRKV